MKIIKAEIANFRALERVSVPLNQFSVILGENDVGKTSFLYALETFFIQKKLGDPKCWYQEKTEVPIRIVLTFSDLPNDDALNSFKRSDDSFVISSIFKFDEKPEYKAILEDQSATAIPAPVLKKWFSQDSFHFIPVRRDLAVQFSMNKTALLGKLLRAEMNQAIEATGADQSLIKIKSILSDAINQPREKMQTFLREQLHNNTIELGFNDLDIDPTEGVTFSVQLSDDRVKNIEIASRGAGTQNNLIIALFR